MSKLFFFVDDSGSKDWETPYALSFAEKPPERTDANLNFWRGNFFVLAGIHVEGGRIASINPKIDEMKQDFFGTTFIEIKSEWLRNPHKRKKHYLEPFKKTEEELKDFVENKWYKLFENHTKEIQIQAFVIDKRFYNTKRSKVTPFQELVQVLFDRVELHKNCACTIVFDQMDADIKSQKHQQGEIFSISRKQLDLGSLHEKYSHTEIRFEKSHHSNFLQLADTAAYNVFRQFVQHGDSWEGADGDTLKEYAYFSKILPNFYTKHGVVAGYGLVKVPDTKKIRWSHNTDAQKNPTNL